MRGDLHCHTNVSDGSVPPGDLIDYAARIGLDIIAVTDHDSMAGVAVAQARAQQYGIKLIPGIEVSTFDNAHGKKAHLLCYGPKDPAPVIALCDKTLRARTDAGLAIIRKVKAKYPVDLATVRKYSAGSAAIYKQHISMALSDMGYSLSVFSELYWELFSSKTGWAYVEPEFPDTREALKAVKQTGGLAVLAHPGVYGNFEIIDELCDLGLDGIEVLHPRHTEEDEKAAGAAAQRRGLIMTGGSDFHGMYSTKINPLASRTAPENTLAFMLERCLGSGF